MCGERRKTEKEGAGLPLPHATLDKSPFRERKDCLSTDNEMIENADVDQRKRLFEGLGQGLVRMTGLSATGGMVVHVTCRGSLCCGVDWMRGFGCDVRDFSGVW